jgi:hypothetical protein
MVHFNNANINRLHTKTISEAGYAAKQVPPINSGEDKENVEGSIKGWHYCWSHGVNMTHMGANCKNPKEGHINAATILNLQGGSNLIYAPFTKRTGGRGGRVRGDGGRGRGPVIPPVFPVIE